MTFLGSGAPSHDIRLTSLSLSRYESLFVHSLLSKLTKPQASIRFSAIEAHLLKPLATLESLRPSAHHKPKGLPGRAERMG